MKDLKPCPFCNSSDPEYCEPRPSPTGSLCPSIHCESCGATFYNGIYDLNTLSNIMKEWTIEAWNERDGPL